MREQERSPCDRWRSSAGSGGRRASCARGAPVSNKGDVSPGSPGCRETRRCENPTERTAAWAFSRFSYFSWLEKERVGRWRSSRRRSAPWAFACARSIARKTRRTGRTRRKPTPRHCELGFSISWFVSNQEAATATGKLSPQHALVVRGRRPDLGVRRLSLRCARPFCAVAARPLPRPVFRAPRGAQLGERRELS